MENNINDICVYTGLDGLKTGSITNIKDLKEEFIKSQNGLFISDFDKCLTKDDFGVTCFKMWLRDIDKWNYSPEKFAEILLPQKEPTDGNIISYYDLVKNAINNPKSKISDHQNAQKVMALYHEITELYKQIKKSSTPELKKEFENKMVEFDNVTYKLEPYFQEFFGNQIFFRLRFWAGNNHIMAKNNSHQAITEGRLQINKDLFDFYAQLKSEGHNSAIITTNYFSTVREAVNRTILNQIFAEKDVYATKMQGNLDKSKSVYQIKKQILGAPVINDQKAFIAKQASVLKNRELILAAGDSPRGDGKMIGEVLSRSGVGIIPVQENSDIQKIAQKFQKSIQEYLNLTEIPEEMKQRMWFLPSNNYVDSRNIK